ncbi:SOS response-associated peptidase [Ramlibacter humi]|uniref:Abasic site processing protein n=1 Tax=Ramlibacter humi TaxID=2530451 RepID=A0A4Z0CE79_9BURK|nr:SOS response-associated peptidase family protein [Ramlibacter humi]TFZ08918.1 SOS response-associated peptidase [Ramlibacter humi]
MCSNYVPVTGSGRLLEFFGVERGRDGEPTDTWPLGLAPFIRLAQDGSGFERVVDDGFFGLLPDFATEIAFGRHTYNARSETVHRLPSFRDAWARGWRCVIPCEAIYEPCWETGQAVRWAIAQEDGKPFGVAGLWRPWRHPDGREVLSFAMLTVNADGHPLMQRFHRPEDEKRMVVILDPEDYGNWLTCRVQDAPNYFRTWDKPLAAYPSPLPPRAPKAGSVRTLRPPPAPPPQASLF